MAIETLTLGVTLKAWARVALWIGERSPRLLGLIVLAIGEDRFIALVVRHGIKITAA